MTLKLAERSTDSAGGWIGKMWKSFLHLRALVRISRRRRESGINLRWVEVTLVETRNAEIISRYLPCGIQMNPSVLFTYARASTYRLVARGTGRRRSEHRLSRARSALRVRASFSSFSSFFILIPLCSSCSSLHLQSPSRFLPCKFTHPSLALRHRAPARPCLSPSSHLHPSVPFVGESIPSIPSSIYLSAGELRAFSRFFQFCYMPACLPACWVYDRGLKAKRIKLGTIAISAADNNLKIFLAHSALGCPNLYAASILDLQFRPLTNSLLIFSIPRFHRWTQYKPFYLSLLAVLHPSSSFVYVPDPFKDRSPRYPFLCRSRLIYIPAATWLASPLNSFTCQASSHRRDLRFVPSFRPSSFAILWKTRLRAASIMESESGYWGNLVVKGCDDNRALPRKPFIKFLITEIIVIEIEPQWMMFASVRIAPRVAKGDDGGGRKMIEDWAVGRRRAR